MANLRCEMTILTDDEARRIHEAAVRTLGKTGIKVEHGRMLGILRDFGAEVNFHTQTVKIPARIVEESLRRHVKKCNDSSGSIRSQAAGAGKMSLCSHIFCINLFDAATADIRPATLKDLDEATVLADALDNVSYVGPLVVPGDVPVELNDAYMWATVLKRTTKNPSGELLNPGTMPFIREMCVVAAGSKEKFMANPRMMYACFPTSPLSFSGYALDMAFQSIDLDIPVRFGAPMVVAGFTAPVTLAGALTVATAESLAALVMGEAVGGIHGGSFGFSITANQSNGTALYASPEKTLMCYALRDLARFYGILDWRQYGGHVGCSDACMPGMQAGFEKGYQLMFAGMAAQGDSVGYCGMLSPEVACVPQMAVDDEMCSMFNRMGRGIEVNDDTIAEDLIQSLGIHGNYIDPMAEGALDHMVQHYRQEYWLPKLFVFERPQSWRRERRDLFEMAYEKTKKILAQCDPHPLGEDGEREIDAILARCVRQIN